jgi:hypothetical protein
MGRDFRMRSTLNAKEMTMVSRVRSAGSTAKARGTVRAKVKNTIWKRLGIALLFLAVAVVALTGCAEPAAIAAVEPTATAFAPPPTDIPPPPSGPTPAALDFPLAAPTHVDLEPADDQSCVDCHTDEDTLRAVASREEVSQESLSEGEG